MKEHRAVKGVLNVIYAGNFAEEKGIICDFAKFLVAKD